MFSEITEEISEAAIASVLTSLAVSCFWIIYFLFVRDLLNNCFSGKGSSSSKGKKGQQQKEEELEDGKRSPRTSPQTSSSSPPPSRGAGTGGTGGTGSTAASKGQISEEHDLDDMVYIEEDGGSFAAVPSNGYAIPDGRKPLPAGKQPANGYALPAGGSVRPPAVDLAAASRGYALPPPSYSQPPPASNSLPPPGSYALPPPASYALPPPATYSPKAPTSTSSNQQRESPPPAYAGFGGYAMPPPRDDKPKRTWMDAPEGVKPIPADLAMETHYVQPPPLGYQLPKGMQHGGPLSDLE